MHDDLIPIPWNDSMFKDCDESVKRFKEVYIEPLNRPTSNNYQSPLHDTILNNPSNTNFSLQDEFSNFTNSGIENIPNERSEYSKDISEESIPIMTGDDVLGYVARAVCIFGIAGNLLNIYVLTRRRMRRSMMDHMEKCAQLGLLSLAISDLILCAGHLVHSVALVGPSQVVAYINHSQYPLLLLSVYGEGLLNWLSLSGTFLTVVVAVGRFLVVCRPLHARSLISVRGTKLALIGAWILALVFNLPRFFHYEVAVYPSCTERCPCSFKTREVGWLFRSQRKLLLIYKFTYFILCVTCPLILLIVCNACLILALRKSKELQESCVADDPSRRRNRQSSRNRITPTLICLVAAFVLLVGPSEIVTFLRDERSAVANFAGFRMAVEITNLFQLINYAANFILYCTVNADFRKICIDLVSCRRQKRTRMMNANCFSENEQALSGHQRHKFISMRRLQCWRRLPLDTGHDGKKCRHVELSRASQTCLTSFALKSQTCRIGGDIASN